MEMPRRGDRDRPAAARAAKRRRRASPLTRRILAVNLIALLIPIAGLLFLGPYRDRLIDQEMQALRVQGELFAGALGEGAIRILDNGQEVLNLVPAREIVRRLSRPSDIWARLYLRDGTLAADSRIVGTIGALVEVQRLPPRERESALDWAEPAIGVFEQVANAFSDRQIDPLPDGFDRDGTELPELRRAFAGEIAGAVRRDPDGRLVLTVALPVQRFHQVFGGLILTHDGAAIERALREVRLSILIVFAVAAAITIALSLYLAGTIARPIHRLADAAERVRLTVGRTDAEIPDFSARGDEIGDLSGDLRAMTGALRLRLGAIERFAADVAHEIKNPLTSLRSAVETAARVTDPAQQKQLMGIILEDVQRLDRLISDISDASRLDAELTRLETEPVDLAALLGGLAEMHGTAHGEDADAPRVTVEIAGNGPFLVQGVGDRLVQIFRNLIGNAVSFSPPGGRIGLTLARDEAGFLEARVEDEGPGIPEAKLETIFERFYTERPSAEKFGTHSGLGLSISKQIAEAHGGSLRAENRRGPDGRIAGARFVLRLPAAG